MPDDFNFLAGYIDRRELARQISSTVATIDNYRKAGLPSVRVGRHIYIPVAEAREWVDRRVVRREPQQQVTEDV